MMSNDERDKMMLFLIERHEEVIADLSVLKDAQLNINTQIEKLNKVLFGLAKQVNELVSKLKIEEEDKDDFLGVVPRMPKKVKK
jgi:predicted transcriptional regulator